MELGIYANWQDRIKFSPAGPEPQVLSEADGLKVILGGLEPGQHIPSHPEALGVYHFLTGQGWMIVDDRRFAVAPGMTVVVPDGASRGVDATEQLAFLVVRVPAR